MRTALLCAAILVSACSSSLRTDAGSSGIELKVEPDEVSAGDSVTLELDNGSPGEIGYNLCNSGMERRSSSGWEDVPSDRVCTLELRILAAGDEARYGLRLPAGLAPGQYRFHTMVAFQDTGASERLRSDSFRVRP